MTTISFRTLFALLTIGTATLLPLQAKAPSYSEIAVTTASIGQPADQLQLTETVVQEGAATINRFTMHRLRRLNVHYKGVILLLPSLGNGFRSYLFSEDGDASKSFAAYFAKIGYEVWGYSPRETGIATGTCGAALDCSPALQWGMKTIVEDVSFIRKKIKALTPGKDPVLGGLSLGAMSALAVVNDRPQDYAGLFAWEGTLVSSDPVVRAHNQTFCTQFDGLLAAGVAVDDQSQSFVKLVAQLALVAPDAPFAIPVPGFPPGLTNHQALVFILATPNPFAPSPRPGFLAAAGDVGTSQFFNSTTARLAGSIGLFNDVITTRVTRDIYCSLAGVETAFTDRLSKFKQPAILIKGGLGFGPVMDELSGKLGSTAVTSLGAPNFGHVDHLGSANHVALFEAPVAQWLEQIFP